jgi:hypothetical protein
MAISAPPSTTQENMIHMKKKIIARDHNWMLPTLQITINTP